MLVAGLLVAALAGGGSFPADGSEVGKNVSKASIQVQVYGIWEVYVPPEPPVPPPAPDVVHLSWVPYLVDLPWLDSQSHEDWQNETEDSCPGVTGPSNRQNATLQAQVVWGHMSPEKHLSVFFHAHYG